MIDDLLVTVVIPVFNVEKYLERCLCSVVNQTYKNLEILLIDDGSTDKCPEICDAWEKKDKRIKVIHKANQGLGMARNSGILNATGDFICFWDSDDYVELNTIESCIKNINKCDLPDAIIYGSKFIDKSGEITDRRVLNPPSQIYKSDEVQNIFLPALIASKWNMLMSAWSCMYNMNLIREIKFLFVSERSIISEDVYSLLIFYNYVHHVRIINEASYCYCENPRSLTHTYRKDRYEKIKQFYTECMKICTDFGYNDATKGGLSISYYSYVVAAIKMIINSEETKSEKVALISEIVEDDCLQQALKIFKGYTHSIKKRLMVSVISLKNGFILYYLLKIFYRDN